MVAGLEPYKVRKLYLVNGGHLALAIRGAYLEMDSLRDTAQEGDFLVEVTALHCSMILGMSHGDLEFPPEPHEYAKEHVAAYCEVADDVSRIMRPLTRADLTPFLSVVKERLTDAAVLTGDAERVLTRERGAQAWLDPYGMVFDRLEGVLGRLRSYSDVDLRSPKTFLEKPDRDEESLDAYEGCLAWISEGAERDRRLRRLAQALSDQRAELAARGTARRILRADQEARNSEEEFLVDRWSDKPTDRESVGERPNRRLQGERRQRKLSYIGPERRSGDDRRQGDAPVAER